MDFFLPVLPCNTKKLTSTWMTGREEMSWGLNSNAKCHNRVTQTCSKPEPNLNTSYLMKLCWNKNSVYVDDVPPTWPPSDIKSSHKMNLKATKSPFLVKEQHRVWNMAQTNGTGSVFGQGVHHLLLVHVRLFLLNFPECNFLVCFSRSRWNSRVHSEEKLNHEERVWTDFL